MVDDGGPGVVDARGHDFTRSKYNHLLLIITSLLRPTIEHTRVKQQGKAFTCSRWGRGTCSDVQLWDGL